MFARLLWLTLLGLSGCGQEVLEPRDPTPGVPHFTIATFNVLNVRSSDSATVSAVGETDADIVCLQEVTSAWRDVLRDRYSDEYPYMQFATNEDAAGLGVLSRFPLSDARLADAPYNWHPAWVFDVQTPAGWLQVLNVHLRANFSDRDNAIESYLTVKEDHLTEIKGFSAACTQDVPTLVLGDFNEEAGSAISYLESQGYRDVLPLYHPGQFTWRQASVGGQLNEAIDHILFDPSLESLNARVIVRGHSDHIPVIAHFEEAQAWPTLHYSLAVSDALPENAH